MSAPTPAATTTDDDLLGMRVAHRMMRRDARRLAELAGRWAAGTETVGRRRAAAFARWTADLCTEIHHHHAVEDDVLWPVLERHAGAEVDLAALTDDHAALDPLLDGIREAVDAGDAARAAAALTTLADLLDEHVVDEERELFGIITRYVPADDWTRVEDAARRGGAGLRFVLPRVAGVVTDDEFARMRAEAGPVLVVLLRVLRPGHRRRERLVFG